MSYRIEAEVQRFAPGALIENTAVQYRDGSWVGTIGRRVDQPYRRTVYNPRESLEIPKFVLIRGAEVGLSSNAIAIE